MARFSMPSLVPISNHEIEEPRVSLSDHWEPLIKILKRPPNQRNSRSLQSLVELAKTIKFFKELALEMSDDAVNQCCLHMTYEYYAQGTFIFHQGNPGSKFYILLQGSCTVYVLLPSSFSPTPVSQYQQGDSFGELALLHNKPRAASIECATDVHLAVLDKDDYTRILAKVHEIALKRKAEFLHKLPMFGGWTMGSMQKLIYYFKERVLLRKQILHKEGDTVDTIYFVREGEMQLVQDVRLTSSATHMNLRKFQTTKAEVATLGIGECIGAEEAIGAGVYRYTVVCASVTSRLLAISREDFLKRINTEETLAVIKNLMKVKEGLRKKQVEGGRNVRKINIYSSSDFLSEPPSLGSSPLLSSRSEQAPSITPIPEEVSRLYPSRLDRHETTPTAANSSKNTTRRLQYWDKFLSHGKNLFSKQQSRARGASKGKIVNIHVHKLKLADIGSSYLQEERVYDTFAAATTSRANLHASLQADATVDIPCLKINSIEVMERTSEDSTKSYAQFRPRNVRSLKGNQ
jgi:CRP-like cAMP-binding protein